MSEQQVSVEDFEAEVRAFLEANTTRTKQTVKTDNYRLGGYSPSFCKIYGCMLWSLRSGTRRSALSPSAIGVTASSTVIAESEF